MKKTITLKENELISLIERILNGSDLLFEGRKAFRKDEYGFNPKEATAEQVVDYIISKGYKTKEEFRTNSYYLYNFMPKEVRKQVMPLLGKNYKYGFNVEKAKPEEILKYIKLKKFKTWYDFTSNSANLLSNISLEVRREVQRLANIYFSNMTDNEMSDEDTPTPKVKSGLKNLLGLPIKDLNPKYVFNPKTASEYEILEYFIQNNIRDEEDFYELLNNDDATIYILKKNQFKKVLNVFQKMKQNYNITSTSTIPNISFKYNIKDVRDKKNIKEETGTASAGAYSTALDQPIRRKIRTGLTKEEFIKLKEYMKMDESLEEGRKKTGTPLCARGKAAAKAKFKVYPSAYSSGYGVQVCKGRMPGLDGKKRCSGAYC